MSSDPSVTGGDVIERSTIAFIRCWCYSMFVLGIVGHSLSIYIFTRHSLRSNPCARYFLMSTLSGYFVVCINIPLRLLQAGYSVPIFTTSSISCIILTWVLFWARALVPWFIVLACADRFLCSSSSATVRAWSCLRVVSRISPIVSLMVGIGYIHVLIYFQVNPRNQLCAPTQGIYQVFLGAWNLVIFSLGPSILMLLFGFLTIRHVRQVVRRVVPHNTQAQTQWQPQQRRKTADRQLIQMMLVQCLVFSLTATPNSIYFFYSSMTSSVLVDGLQTAKDNLFNNIAGFVSLTVPCTSFYLFTLSSQLFRRELLHLFPGRRISNAEITMNQIGQTRRN